MAASCRLRSSTKACRHSGLSVRAIQKARRWRAFVHMTPWIRYDGPRLVPAFRASRSRLLAEPLLGEPQPCDIDINPLAHHSGSRLSYLRLLSLIATAQGHLVVNGAQPAWAW